MKPFFVRVTQDLNEVFTVRVIDVPCFPNEFHFHKECQLVYVIRSSGKRIIGDNIENFCADEVILIGSDLPHVWYNDSLNLQKNGKPITALAIALFFDPEKLLPLLDNFGSVNKLEDFLQQAKRGMKFLGKTKKIIKELLLDVKDQEGLPKLITVLQIFDLWVKTPQFELLASNGYVNTFRVKDNEKMGAVLQYVLNNFSSGITLEAAAAVANMNKQAFCRYFKIRTQKTFVHFVNEVRIGHACRLLTSGEKYIASVAYDCGYNSVSNFNKFFKKIKGVTPKEFDNEMVLLSKPSRVRKNRLIQARTINRIKIS